MKAMVSGSGYGDGSRYGYGYGDGYGYGYGYGCRYGDGYGDGEGYGYVGSRYGSRYGDGYGDGYGEGSGDKDANINYWKAVLLPYNKPGVSVFFWRCNMNGAPSNGGKNVTAEEGKTDVEAGELRLCTNGLHGTLQPQKWIGDGWWIVALHHPVVGDASKSASLKRTYLKNLGKCPFE